MDSVAVTVPLRPPTKKMKKRKELDALAPSHVISRRTSGKRSSQELLTDSSDDRSEYWNIPIRGKRKNRSRKNRVCPGLLKACSAFFGCASILATASLIWLFIDVRQQLTLLRTEVDQAIAGSEDVPDALQKCHSLSKDLQKNQTILFDDLKEVRNEMTNFTLQLSNIQQRLQQMQSLIHGVPELTTVPNKIEGVFKSVAIIGSTISGLNESVRNLEETNKKLRDAQNILQVNMTSTKDTLDVLQNTTQNTSAKILSLVKSCVNASEQESLIQSVNKLIIDVESGHTLGINLTNKIQQLEQNYNSLKNMTNAIISSTSNMKNSELNVDVLSTMEHIPPLHNRTGSKKITTDGLLG